MNDIMRLNEGNMFLYVFPSFFMLNINFFNI